MFPAAEGFFPLNIYLAERQRWVEEKMEPGAPSGSPLWVGKVPSGTQEQGAGLEVVIQLFVLQHWPKVKSCTARRVSFSFS